LPQVVEPEGPVGDLVAFGRDRPDERAIEVGNSDGWPRRNGTRSRTMSWVPDPAVIQCTTRSSPGAEPPRSEPDMRERRIETSVSPIAVYRYVKSSSVRRAAHCLPA
jgi:hypothetical protein